MKPRGTRTSIDLSKHVPRAVCNLMEKISSVDGKHLALIGFGENMKWLSRLLSDKYLELFDWREEFFGYDCGNREVDDLSKSPTADFYVICADSNIEQMMAVEFLIENDILDKPIINSTTEEGFVLLKDLRPFDSIFARSKRRVGNVSHDVTALGNVVQCVHLTKHLQEPMVEFGVFNGGTASLMYETEKQNNPTRPRELFLFDTFSGIHPTLGIDKRWENCFSNNSQTEVSKKFSDTNAIIVPGDILKNLDSIPDSLSFAHIDVDTYETTSKLIPVVWDALCFGGIVLFDDYGFFPNCIPATIAVNRFFDGVDSAFLYVLPNNSCFVLKK